MDDLIRIGTRESNLALTQTKLVIDKIKTKFPSLKFEIVGIKTSGDKILDKKLDKIGGKGLFIKELEQALLDEKIDIAVHSMKDVPGILSEGLYIAAVSESEDPSDALITLNGNTLKDLKEGSIIGTSSVRREVQILDLRPDLKIKTLRGNVETRINKLKNSEYDAIILAMAGINRLKIKDLQLQRFDPMEIIPSVGQGVLGIEVRKGYPIDFLLEAVNNEEANYRIAAERSFLIKLNGNCSTPLAAHAVINGDKIIIYGMLASDDKSVMFKDKIEGNKKDAKNLGEELAQRLFKRVNGGLENECR